MNKIIVALDVSSAEQATRIIHLLGAEADFYKVGLELYAAAGMDFVSQISNTFEKRVFLDLKLYDIGETVQRATRQICQNEVAFLSVHARPKVMQAALKGRGDSPTNLLGVTVLTNLNQSDIVGIRLADLVERRTREAVEVGMDGLVCSPLEVARVREIAGPGAILITPGVRSAGVATGDQQRLATPCQAIANGADYVIVGRQITQAADPREAFEQVTAELQ